MGRCTISGKQKGVTRMDNKQLAEVAKILGVSEDSISAMDDEIKNSMTAVFEQVAVKNDEEKKALSTLSLQRSQSPRASPLKRSAVLTMRLSRLSSMSS